MVDYVAIGNVPVEEFFGLKEDLKFILHGMNCTKKICLIIAALEKRDRGIDWKWNVNYPEALARKVVDLVADKLGEDFNISLPDLTEFVLKQVYEDYGNTLKKELER